MVETEVGDKLSNALGACFKYLLVSTANSFCSMLAIFSEVLVIVPGRSIIPGAVRLSVEVLEPPNERRFEISGIDEAELSLTWPEGSGIDDE